MRRAAALCLLLGLACSAPSATAPPDLGEDMAAAPGGRVYPTSCRLGGTGAQPPRLKLTRVFAGTDLPRPVQMLPVNDGSRRILLVSQLGLIFAADAVTPDGEAPIWLDLTDRVSYGGERGLLSMAFAPDFKQSGLFYLNYTRDHNGGWQTVVSRMRVPGPGRDPDPRSEQILLTITQPYENHNGGQIAFGPDGHLYIGMGDGGAAGDPHDTGQRMDTLLGKILRIDVRPAGAYQIPADNPFYTGQARANGDGADNSHCRTAAGQPGPCGEIWALGLRNPWRFSFDPQDGALYAGDVGQDDREEIDLIEKGKNYGWRCLEGTLLYNDSNCADALARGLLTPPIHEYSHSEGRSVSGGVVYRGRAIPGLVGSYLFGDYVEATLGALTRGRDGAWVPTPLLSDAGNVSGFGVDADGEVYVLDHVASQVLRIDPAQPGEPGPPGWPERLSDTGCFRDLAARRPAAGALSYAVNAPLWSDGADKERLVFLPQGTTLGYQAEGPLGLPPGALVLKTFVLGGAPVETRVLAWDGQGVRGASYRWNAAGTDAQLLPARLVAPAPRGGQDWIFPSRSQCVACHNRAAGLLLGLTAAQMNRAHDVFGVGRAGPQLEVLAQAGYLSGLPADGVPRLPDPAEAGLPGETRARVYLAANCAHCHQPGAFAGVLYATPIDLRLKTALGASKTCDVMPMKGDLGLADPRILAPGQPEQSTLYLRMTATDAHVRMPALSSLKVDEQGTALVRSWIAGLVGCQ